MDEGGGGGGLAAAAAGMRAALQDGVIIGRREGSGGGLSDSCDTYSVLNQETVAVWPHTLGSGLSRPSLISECKFVTFGTSSSCMQRSDFVRGSGTVL